MTMLTKYISEGNTMPYTPGSAVSAGDIVVVGEIVAHAPADIAASVEGNLTVEGVVRFPKNSTSADALTQGTKVYWDAGNEVVTTTASTHKVAGYVHEAAAASDTTVDVKLARA
jgi:predicted RecA/RadA family phage recombinase